MKIHTTWLGSALATDGTTIRIHHAWTAELDFVQGTLTFTGLPFGSRVVGTSISSMDRGRLVLDLATFEPLFVAGKFPLGPVDPHETTCDLIAAAQG